MTSFLDPVIAFVSAHPWLAYLTLFLAALLEAVPVVGALVPGSTIILALSALVPGGELTAVGRAGGGDRRRPARRRLGVLGRPSLATRNPRRLADVGISGRDGAERSVLPPLGNAGGVFRALCAADPRLRAGHGGRARDAARPGSYGVNIPAVLAWALAHVLPGVLAVSALHQYAGLPHHEHVGKHLWMLAVFAAAIIALGVWTLRRRRPKGLGSGAGLRPGAGPT